MTERIRSLQMNEDNRRWWALGAMCFALFMIMLDNTVVNVALPSIQRSLTPPRRRWSGPSTPTRCRSPCCSSPAGASATSSAGGESSSPASSCSRCVERRDRLLAERHLAGRLARGPGHGLGDDDAGDAVDHHQRLPAGRARQGDRHVGRRVGDGARDRPGGRRACSCESVSWQSIFFLNLPVAVGAVDRHAVRRARVARRDAPPQRIDVPGVLTLTIGLAALVLALVEGNAWHWGSTRELALFAIAARRPGRVRRRRAPPALADGRLQLLPLAHVPRREHRRVHRQLRDARDVLLHGAVHAEHPALLAPAGRRALPALDADDRADRAARRAPRRPRRPAAADRRSGCWPSPPRCSGSRS